MKCHHRSIQTPEFGCFCVTVIFRTSHLPLSLVIGFAGTALFGLLDFPSSLEEDFMSICKVESLATFWSDFLFSCRALCIPSFVPEMQTKVFRFSKGSLAARRAWPFWQARLEVLFPIMILNPQVLGEVQSLDLHFRLGRQLLLDALLLRGPPRQVTHIQTCRASSIQLVTRVTCTPSP